MPLTALNAAVRERPLPARRREQAGTRPPRRARARPRTPGRVLLPGIAEDCRVLLPGIAKRKRRSSASAAKRRPLASAAKRKRSQAQAQVKRKRSQAQASRKRRQAQPASSASASKRKRRQAQPAPSARQNSVLLEFCACLCFSNFRIVLGLCLANLGGGSEMTPG